MNDVSMKLDEFRIRHKEMPRAGFLARFFDPFLLVSVTAPGQAGLPAERRRKSTIYTNDRSNGPAMVTFVNAVAKREGRMDDPRVTVGRGEDNDIVIPHPSVSRVHAFIAEDTPQAYTILDGGSSYGTSLNGEDIRPNKPYDLHSGDTLVFGRSARCTFLSPEAFFDFLNAL